MKGFLKFAEEFPKKHKDIFFIILSYCVFAIGGSLYWAAIPIFSGGIFHLNAFDVSLVVAVIGVSYILTDELIGVFVDVVGYKKGVIASLFLASVTAIISILDPSLAIFIIGVAFFAVAWNLLTIATSAYVLYNVKKHEEGRIFGTYGAIYKVGTFTSTLLIGYIVLWKISGVGWFFLFTIAISLLLALFFLNPEKRNYDHKFFHALKEYTKSPIQLKRGWKAMKEFSPVSWVYATNTFISYIFSSVLWFAIPLSLAGFAGSPFPPGSVLSMYEFGGIIFIGLGGFLADRYSRKKIFLALLFALFIISMILGFVSQIVLMLILTFFLAAIIDATATPVEAMIAQVDRNHDKDGTILGFVQLLTDSAFIIGPIASGLLLTGFGLRGIFVFLGLIVFANWIASSILLKKFDDKKYRKPSRKHVVHFGGIPRHHRRRDVPEKQVIKEKNL